MKPGPASAIICIHFIMTLICGGAAPAWSDEVISRLAAEPAATEQGVVLRTHALPRDEDGARRAVSLVTRLSPAGTSLRWNASRAELALLATEETHDAVQELFALLAAARAAQVAPEATAVTAPAPAIESMPQAPPVQMAIWPIALAAAAGAIVGGLLGGIRKRPCVIAEPTVSIQPPVQQTPNTRLDEVCPEILARERERCACLEKDLAGSEAARIEMEARVASLEENGRIQRRRLIECGRELDAARARFAELRQLVGQPEQPLAPARPNAAEPPPAPLPTDRPFTLLPPIRHEPNVS